ncbi:MAG: hypothetical protein FWG83_02830 [Oscillospiraceae bacterium]|nr:hypothetical protein [Oscillospiraceae bacterium]
MKHSKIIAKSNHGNFVKTASKAGITATGMAGTAIGAYYVRNIVADVSDNEVLGVIAGIATLLIGAVVVNEINNAVDKSFEPNPLVIEANPVDLIQTDTEEDDDEIENL